MWVFILLLVAIVGGLAYLIYATRRGMALLQAEWVIETALDEATLIALVKKALKGLNPLAGTRSGDGVISRTINKGTFSSKVHDSATVQISIADAAEGGSRLVQAEIGDWDWGCYAMMSAMGARPVRSIEACAKRIKAVMGKIREADPHAIVHADPHHPDLVGTKI